MKLKQKLWRRALSFISLNSNRPFANRLRHVAYAVYRSTFNPNYHFDLNGEERVLRTICAYFKKKIIFDVGANVGNWTRLAARGCSAEDQIFAFEPSSETFLKLKASVSNVPTVRILNFGLSDSSKKKDLLFSFENPEKSGVEHIALRTLNKKIVDYRSEEQMFVQGDEFCSENEIPEINFLKVDVEGHDLKVLEGFTKMFLEGKIGVVQFEYNRLNIFSGALLMKFYEFLQTEVSSDGYCIGRIYPNSVCFKDFDIQDENFIDGNFIAVKRDFVGLIDILGNSTSSRSF